MRKRPLRWKKQLQALADLIRKTIRPESWGSQNCSISVYVPNKSLVVQHSRKTHESIRAMMLELKKWADMNLAHKSEPHESGDGVSGSRLSAIPRLV